MYKVLLVDDESLALEGLRLLVDWESFGFEIHGECSDGEEAFTLIEKFNPDLVITDIRMPGLDGLGLIEKVAGRAQANPKFIIISGYNEFEYARKALRFGINHYLLKPVFKEDLIAVLQDLYPSPATAEFENSSGNDPVLQNDGGNEVRRILSGPSFQEIFYLNTIMEALEELNPEALETAMESAFTYFGAIQTPSEILKIYAINIIYHSIRLINEMNGNPAELLGKHNLNRLHERQAIALELKMILKGYFTDYFAHLKSLKARDSQNIYKVEAYLKQNFKENLTLKEIAKIFYMHPAYLGQLFVKKFGVSFNEYLHQMRIEEAKRLMETTPLKTFEIALKIGYNHYHSFLQNFEKYTGIKPAEYRKKFNS
jgi:two-component system response regulator YesN